MNYSDRTPRWLDAETAEVSSHPPGGWRRPGGGELHPLGRREGASDRWSGGGRAGRRWGPCRSAPISAWPDTRSPLASCSTTSRPRSSRLGRLAGSLASRPRSCSREAMDELLPLCLRGRPSCEAAGQGLSNATPARHRLTWRCPKPGLGKVFLSDLTWPEDPRLSGYVMVALRGPAPDSEIVRSFTRTTLWWLKLDVAGTEIVECRSRFSCPMTRGAQSTYLLDQRCPTIGTLKGGQACSCLSVRKREAEDKVGNLRVSPIEFEGDHHVPKAHEANTRAPLERLPARSPELLVRRPMAQRDRRIEERRMAGSSACHSPNTSQARSDGELSGPNASSILTRSSKDPARVTPREAGFFRH